MIIDEMPNMPVATDIAADLNNIASIAILPTLLNVICRTTNMRFAAVARVTDEQWITCCVQDEIEFGLKAGDTLNLETTICNEIRQSGKAIIIDNVAEDKDFCNHATPAMYGFQSYISVPIIKRNGSFFGTLCAIDPNPNKLKTEAVTGMFNLFADLISSHLNSAEDASRAAAKLLRERDFHKKTVYDQEKLNIVIEASELGTWEIDLITQEIKYSDRMPEIMGFEKGERPTWEAMRSTIHSADLAKREAAYTEAFKTGKMHFVGRTVWRNGTIHWIESKGRIFFDDGGKPVAVVGAVRDITEEKNVAALLEEKVTERTKQLNEKNSELEKMNKELESFTYISGHDLQEPLRKIQSFAAMIEKENAEMPGKVKDYFSRMQRAAERMQLLLTDLLAYSRTSTEEKKFVPLDMNQLIAEIKEDLKEDLQQKNAVIETKGLCIIDVIPFQMHQLFQNLVTNALKFSDAERSPQVIIESTMASENEIVTLRLDPETTYCKLTVSDNGIGFEQQYSNRIFEVFQRLHGKTAFKGTGIGLAIVKKITENHSGLIIAEGKPGEGATFKIFLPVKQKIAELPAA